MSMQKGKRQELRKLRELVRSLLEGVKCCLCRELLIPEGYVKIGDADGAPVSSKITIHHYDGDHDNDDKSNRRYVHTTCHKSYHMRKQWRAKKMIRRAA